MVSVLVYSTDTVPNGLPNAHKIGIKGEEMRADFEVNLNVHFSDSADCSVYSALQCTFNSKMSSEVSLACIVAVFVCSICVQY